MDDQGSPMLFLLWAWIIVAPVALVLLDALRQRGERRRTRPMAMHDDGRDRGATWTTDPGHPAMARPAGGGVR